MQSSVTNTLTAALTAAATQLGLSLSTPVTLQRPSDLGHGDFVSTIALSLFSLSKTKSSQFTWKSPHDLASDIATRADEYLQQNAPQLVSSVQVAGPGFINFRLQPAYFVSKMAEMVVQPINEHARQKNGKIAIVEYSSPNIAKPFTIGHLRSTIIGEAVAGLLEATGWEVWRDNHLGDWGTQFGKQIYALLHLGEGSLEKNVQRISASQHPVKELVALYVEFHQQAAANPELDEAGREWFAKLEQGDPQARQLWQQCVDWSWQAFDQIYKRLHIRFDEQFDGGRGLGEAFFENKMTVVLDELTQKLGEKPGDTPEKWQKTGVYRQSEHAWLVFFPHDELPPLMIIKEDGSSLYATRDLATDRYRLFDLHPRPDLIVNEVGAEQALYFRQLYRVEELLGWVQPGQRVHVKHGLYRFKDKKMSTRKGDVIWLEDVLEEAQQRALSLSKNQDAAVAEKVAIAALKWNDLKRGATLEVTFDWDEVLNMQGNSGPYMLYTLVRGQSVLQRAAAAIQNTTESLIDTVKLFAKNDTEKYTSLEIDILRKLEKYNDTVAQAASEYSPHIICTFLFDLAQLYNSWYAQERIIDVSNGSLTDLSLQKLQLNAAVTTSMRQGLTILGIQTVTEM